MTTVARMACVAMALTFPALSSPVRAADGAPMDGKAAFARLKTLAGEWKAEAGGHESTVTYRLTSNNSTLVETLFPGTDHEMVSMYHLDGPDLVMTHYCHLGNQPRTKLDAKTSTPDTLVFAFNGGSNFDPAKDLHMHSGEVRFQSGGAVETAWTVYKGEKKVGENSIKMTRK